MHCAFVLTLALFWRLINCIIIIVPRLAGLCDNSFCRSLSVSRITHERVNGRRPNTWAWAWATGDPLEVINFCC